MPEPAKAKEGNVEYRNPPGGTPVDPHKSPPHNVEGKEGGGNFRHDDRYKTK